MSPSSDQPEDPLAAYKDELREKYTLALNAIINETMGRIAAPQDQVAFASDMLEFTGFTIVLKIAEITGADPSDRWALKRIWGALNKAMEQSLAQMLTEYSNAVHFGAEAQG